MFGGNLEPPKHIKHTRPKPMTYDINLPGAVIPGIYGHYARPCNTDYHVQHLHHKQRMESAHLELVSGEAKRLRQEASTARYERHTERAVFKRHVEERFKEKVQAYEDKIEQRRQRLRKLLCDEEQEFIRVTIAEAQQGVACKMQEMKIRAQQLKALREEERMKIVNEKRRQQALEGCTELRPVLAKRNLVDSKHTQLVQIHENQMRKEAEKELDCMWHHLMMKEIEAKVEKEVQDVLNQKHVTNETREVWEKQIRGKQMMMEEAAKVAAEDRIEMQKLQDQLRREQIEALDSKRRKRDIVARELREQVVLQERYAAERKRAEDALNDALCKMAEAEVEKERQKLQDTTSMAKREMAIYRQHIKQLDEERKLEEVQLNQLLEEHRKAVEKKQEEAFCKIKHAREQLQRDVLEGRAQQIEYKRQQAENELKFKQAENELLRMNLDTNERLQAEHDRLQAEEVKQYREDLKKQIEEINLKRIMEKEQLKRELAEGLAEEERRRQHVLALIDSRMNDANFYHPFRRVLEQARCPCPQNQ